MNADRLPDNPDDPTPTPETAHLPDTPHPDNAAQPERDGARQSPPADDPPSPERQPDSEPAQGPRISSPSQNANRSASTPPSRLTLLLALLTPPNPAAAKNMPSHPPSTIIRFRHMMT